MSLAVNWDGRGQSSCEICLALEIRPDSAGRVDVEDLWIYAHKIHI